MPVESRGAPAFSGWLAAEGPRTHYRQIVAEFAVSPNPTVPGEAIGSAARRFRCQLASITGRP